jgi:hypothetical protein
MGYEGGIGLKVVGAFPLLLGFETVRANFTDWWH